MGIFSFFQEAWKTTTDSVKHAYNSVKDKVVDMIEGVKNTAIRFGEMGVSMIEGGVELVKEGAQKGAEIVGTVYEDLKALLNKGLDTFSSPLIWAALGMGGAAILLNRR